MAISAPFTPRSIEKQLTVKTSAYGAAPRSVGGLHSFFVGNISGTITRVKLVDDDNERANVTLYLFNDAPTAFIDDATYAPTIADLKKIVGQVTFITADYTQINSNAVSTKNGLSIKFYIPEGVLYAYLVTDSGTPAYTAATDLTLQITYE